MKKHAYRRTPINNFQPLAVQSGVSERRLVLAIDVAKQDMVAALTTRQAEVLATLAWKHLDETPVLLEKLKELSNLGYAVEAVMESTGTYGDVLRHQLQSSGIVVYQVNGKRVHGKRSMDPM